MKIGIVIKGETFSNKWILHWTSLMSSLVSDNTHAISVLTQNYFVCDDNFKNFCKDLDKVFFISNKTMISKEIFDSLVDLTQTSVMSAMIVGNSIKHIRARENDTDKNEISVEDILKWQKESQSEHTQVFSTHTDCTCIPIHVASLLQFGTNDDTLFNSLKGAGVDVYINNRLKVNYEMNLLI